VFAVTEAVDPYLTPSLLGENVKPVNAMNATAKTNNFFIR
jgi:hypothetical protein